MSIAILSGTAGAHPHEFGNLNHGQPLEKYQVEMGFTTEELIKNRRNSSIAIAKKQRDEDNNGSINKKNINSALKEQNIKKRVQENKTKILKSNYINVYTF